MSSNPLNLALRFLLEIAALVSIGIWGWEVAGNDLKYISAIGIPLVLAILWGILAVRNDPSRSGNAPVPIKGALRFLLEIAFFSFATWCLLQIGNVNLSVIFGAVVLFHYIISYDRIIWLFKH